MAILSKIDLIKRVMIGEMLIYEHTSKEARIKQCLMHIGKRSPPHQKQAEALLKSYFKELASSPEGLLKRKLAIEKYIEDNFLEKTTDEIERMLNEKESLKELKERIRLPIFIHDFDYETCLRGANYDLRLGEDIYVTTERVPRKLTTMGVDGVISIEPGEFGILMAHEFIYVPPDLIGFISIRLTHKQKGLVNISGFHVDPWFYGQLMFAVFNAGPNDVPLRYKEPVFMIMFNKLTKPVQRIQKREWHGMKNIPLGTISGLTGASVSVRNIDERVKKLETIYPVLVTGIAGLIISVLAWLLTHW